MSVSSWCARLPLTLIGAVLLSTGLSLLHFDQSLWSDEATSVWFARQPIGTLLAALCDPHPAGYYVLLQGWLLGGEGETWLRLLSLGAGAFTVVVTYRLARDWCGTRCASLAALLLALQPIHSWYAAEVRMYALVTGLSVLAVWLGWRALGTGTWRDLLRYALAATLAMCIDYSAVLPLGLLQLMWLAGNFPHRRSWLITHALLALPIGLFLLSGWQVLALDNNIYPIFLAIRATALGVPLSPAQADVILQALSLIGAIEVVSIALSYRGRSYLRSKRETWLVVALWIGVLLLALLPQAFTIKRRLLPVLPLLAIAAAYALSQRSKLLTRMTLAAGVALSGLAVLTWQREPWREVVAQTLAAPPQTVIWVDDLSVPAFDYYARRTPAPNGLRWATLTGRDLPQVPTLVPPPGGRLRIIEADNGFRRLLPFLPPAFEAEYEPLGVTRAPGIAVYEFRRRTGEHTPAPYLPAPTLIDEWGLTLMSPLDTCVR